MWDALSKLDGGSEGRFIENCDQQHFICSSWHTDWGLISTHTCESFAEHSHHFIGCLAIVFLDKIFETRQDVQFFFAIKFFFCWNISLGWSCYPLIRKYLPLLSYRSRWGWILISDLTRVRIHNPTRPQGTHYKALARVLHSITSLAICAPSVPF